MYKLNRSNEETMHIFHRYNVQRSHSLKPTNLLASCLILASNSRLSMRELGA